MTRPTMKNEWSVTFRDRAFVTFKPAGKSVAQGATLLVNALYSGHVLSGSTGSVVDPSSATSALDGVVKALSNETPDADVGSFEAILEKLWTNLAAMSPGGATGLTVTAQASDILSLKLAGAFPAAAAASRHSSTGASWQWTMALKHQICSGRSLNAEPSGVYQNLTGSSWAVTAELTGGSGRGPLLVDHAQAADLLATVCAQFDLSTLASHPDFAAVHATNTTPCEFVARAVWRGLAEGLLQLLPTSTSNEDGAAMAAASAPIKVTVHESQDACVEYEQTLAAHVAEAHAAKTAEEAIQAEAAADATVAAAACAAAAAANEGNNNGSASSSMTAAAKGTASALAAHATESCAASTAAAQASVDASVEAQRLNASECWRLAVHGCTLAPSSVSFPTSNSTTANSLGAPLVVDAFFESSGLQTPDSGSGRMDASTLAGLVHEVCSAVHQRLNDSSGGEKGVVRLPSMSPAAAHELWRQLVAHLPPTVRAQCRALKVVLRNPSSLAMPQVAYAAPLWPDATNQQEEGQGEGKGGRVPYGLPPGSPRGLAVLPDAHAALALAARAEARQAAKNKSPTSSPSSSVPQVGKARAVFESLPTQSPALTAAAGRAAKRAADAANCSGRIPVLLIDLDNCAFTSPLLNAGSGCAIARGVHAHGAHTYGLNPAECDALHASHGDCIAGLHKLGLLGKPKGGVTEAIAASSLVAVGGSTTSVGSAGAGGVNAGANFASGGPLPPPPALASGLASLGRMVTGVEWSDSDDSDTPSSSSPQAHQQELDESAKIAALFEAKAAQALYEAPDGFQGTYEQVLAHEKLHLGLSAMSADLGGEVAIGAKNSAKKKKAQGQGQGVDSEGVLSPIELAGARAYYQAVFGGLNLDELLPSSTSSSSSSSVVTGGVATAPGEAGAPTGILGQHDTQLAALLANLPCPKVLASNSPQSLYVNPVLHKLGLSPDQVGWASVLTPETWLGRLDQNDNDDDHNNSSGSSDQSPRRLFTKGSPAFWLASGLLEQYPPELYQLVLFDDSVVNLEAAAAVGITPYLVHAKKRPLYDALLEALQVLPPRAPPAATMLASGSSNSSDVDDDDDQSEATAYLTAKAAAEDASFSEEVAASLVQHLTELHASLRFASGGNGHESELDASLPAGAHTVSTLPSWAQAAKKDNNNNNTSGNEEPVLRVADWGAGCLSMLPRICALAYRAGFRVVDYVAVEPQAALLASGFAKLEKEQGLKVEEDTSANCEIADGQAAATAVARGVRVGQMTAPASAHGDGENSGANGNDCSVQVRVVGIAETVEKVSVDRLAKALNWRPRHGGLKGYIDSSTSFLTSTSAPADLVVACSFADLLEPSRLAALVTARAPGALLYLPITFAGRTQFEPANGAAVAAAAADGGGEDSDGAACCVPMGPPSVGLALLPAAGSSDGVGDGIMSDDGRVGRVPPDSEVENLYHAHLMHTEGQHIYTLALLAALAGAGSTLLAQGASDWRLDPSNAAQKPMWDAMLRFLCRATAPQLFQRGWSPAQWALSKHGGCPPGVMPDGGLGRSTGSNSSGTSSSRPMPWVVVANQDLLFRVPNSRVWQKPRYEVMEMVAPRTVAVKVRARSTPGPGRGMVEVASVRSMISNGTELKFWRGDFGGDDEDDDEGLDATIEGLAEQKMQYPLEYGYSMVGRPVAFGEGVDPADWLLPDSNSSSNGDLASKTTAAAVGPAPLVFCFHPHASSCEVAASGLMPVPPGIAASDAVFLPAVETALSIVHDAHPRVGERVAVFGQGLVGLLVTTILGRSGFHVIAVDGRADRRRLALQCGASEAVSPPSGASASKQVALQRCVDIAVEVSGNPKALQAALNATMKGGKVVVASWYSSKTPVELNLGTAFHRSHVTLVASQVSELPHAFGMGTWSKHRRFEHAWQLVRQLQPSRLLSPRLRSPLHNIGSAYERLDRGHVVTALVVYAEPDEEDAEEKADGSTRSRL